MNDRIQSINERLVAMQLRQYTKAMKTSCFIASLLRRRWVIKIVPRGSSSRMKGQKMQRWEPTYVQLREKNICYLVFTYKGLLREEYHITADSNKMLTSAYVGLHVQRCPRLFHLLRIIMNWGRRRQINGYHEKLFLTDEQLAIIFITFCEKSGFINEVNFYLG